MYPVTYYYITLSARKVMLKIFLWQIVIYFITTYLLSIILLNVKKLYHRYVYVGKTTEHAGFDIIWSFGNLLVVL
jgi:hypothetical protein